MIKSLVITRPDDWHVHFRDGEVLKDTVLATAQHFSRALAMPNLVPPLTKFEDLVEYHHRIKSVLPPTHEFTPYVTFYLNETVSLQDLQKAASTSFILGAKLYPAGATTNSEQGAKSIEALYPLLDFMQNHDLVLQIHGEVTHGDIFEREQAFLYEYLDGLLKNFPKLRMVLEHISTRAAVEFITQAPERLGATITPHHLLYNRNHMLVGGVKPHYYCLPILKSQSDQFALQEAAVSGNPKFFAGTDSAPHSQQKKENACGCAGVYSAPYAVSMYAQLFAELNQLEKLENFLSHFGAHFYNLPVSTQFIELIQIPQTVADSLPLGGDQVIPANAGQLLSWSVHE
jgi:dihydroorotase